MNLRTMAFMLCVWMAAHVQAQLPATTRQLIVTVAEDWDSHRASMWWFSRAKANGPWQITQQEPIPVLLGKNGLAWGRGLLPVPHGERGLPSKQERDGRAPAGCFALGMLFGNADNAPENVKYPYYQVTARDCWIDDVNHPAYNKHVTVDVNNLPPWYAKQRMRLGDFAYEWLLEIRHNAAPPEPGAGSAIFFHIRRGPDKPTSGCTTMQRENLLRLLGWLQPAAQPLYVLLPRAEYQTRLKSWGLPALPP